MDWLAIPFLLFIFFLACFICWHETKQQRQAAEEMLQLQAVRPAISADEVAQDCGEDMPTETAERVLRILAKISEFSLSPPGVEVNPNRLRSGDALCENLGYHLDSLAFFELFTELEKEFGIQLIIKDFTKAPEPVVRDVIRLVARKLKS
jgi:acyl carrier protein